jgi:hypothetical protein
MAGRDEATKGAEGPRDRRSEIGGRKTERILETTGDLAPVYQGEGEQGREGLSRSEKDVEFVNETMRTGQIQSIITRIEMVAQDLIQTASGDDARRLKRSMRAFKSALAWGMGILDHIGQHCKWPPTVKSEVASRVSEMTKAPLEFAVKRRLQMSPTSWAAECSAHVAWAKGLIEMMHPAVTREGWSLMDCQEYFVDLDMSLAGVATALEVSAPGQLRDDQMGVYRELELEVGVAPGLANKFRARHLEAYDLQGGPVAFADSSGIGKRLMMTRMRLDEKLAANLQPDHAERTARMLLQRLSQEGGTERPSAPPPSPPEQGDASEGAWPWFSGRMEDLLWFRQAWEAHVQRFHHGLAPEVLVGGLRKYCMPRAASRMVEPARDPEEAWRILEAYFARQTRALDELISDILSYERMVNDSQTLAHYSRILMAIREAKEIGRLPDLLTDSRIKVLMEVLPKKESNYWRQEQVGVRPKDMPVAFYSFIRARALELGSNAASTRVARDDIDEQEPVWEGPCVLGDLCGGSYAPERCSLFVDLAPEDRLVVIQRKQLCYLCFRHADSQPCKSQSGILRWGMCAYAQQAAARSIAERRDQSYSD